MAVSVGVGVGVGVALNRDEMVIMSNIWCVGSSVAWFGRYSYTREKRSRG